MSTARGVIDVLSCAADIVVNLMQASKFFKSSSYILQPDSFATLGKLESVLPVILTFIYNILEGIKLLMIRIN